MLLLANVVMTALLEYLNHDKINRLGYVISHLAFSTSIQYFYPSLLWCECYAISPGVRKGPDVLPFISLRSANAVITINLLHYSFE